MSDAVQVTDNPSEGRFEARVEGHLAVLEYDIDDDGRRLLHHTEVPSELEGRGIGGQLARAAFAWARANGQKVVVTCPFVTRWLERHPEQADVVA